MVAVKKRFTSTVTFKNEFSDSKIAKISCAALRPRGLSIQSIQSTDCFLQSQILTFTIFIVIDTIKALKPNPAFRLQYNCH